MNIIIAIVILAVYTLVLIRIGGQIPSSLSASVFSLPMNKRWIWTVVLAAVCFLCDPTYVCKAGDNTQFLAFIAISALAFVGAAPLVRDRNDLAYKVHCVAAGFIIGLGKWRTMTFWAEMVCFVSTFAFCLI